MSWHWNKQNLKDSISFSSSGYACLPYPALCGTVKFIRFTLHYFTCHGCHLICSEEAIAYSLRIVCSMVVNRAFVIVFCSDNNLRILYNYKLASNWNVQAL